MQGHFGGLIFLEVFNLGFQVQKAVREKIYTKVALMSPSGGGKTYSALRLAKGMAQEIERENGKKAKILMANTEHARGRYYANEFDYDIIDLDPPYNPELFVDAINFAVEQGYDILIMDSTSPEWDGQGGCLELQQKAGGTWNSWKSVTPRHDAFINALASSPIHIIATMRGKDQYEMEQDNNGKKSVKKLGVGAKQRDGFEYEFTCTFLLDLKSHAADPQKDNTHIFENSASSMLSEEHGVKIIKWANSSDIEPQRNIAQNAVVKKDSNDLQSYINEILKVATKLIAVDKAGTLELIKQFAANGNPKSITDIKAAKELYKALKEREAD